MSNSNAACKRYCTQVQSWLPCSRKLKRQIMERLTDSINAYLEQEPGTDFEQLQAHFGTPETIAAAYIDEMGTDVLLQDLRIRRKIVSIVAGVMAAVLAIWILAVGWAVVREIESSGGVLDREPIIEIEG